MKYPYTITLDASDFCEIVELGLRQAVGVAGSSTKVLSKADTVSHVTVNNGTSDLRFSIEIEGGDE